MTSYELIKLIEKFSDDLRRNSILMKTLRNFAHEYDIITQKGITSGGGVQVEGRTGAEIRLFRFLYRSAKGFFARQTSEDRLVLDIYDHMHAVLTENWSRKLFSDIDDLEEAITEIVIALDEHDAFFSPLKAALSEFASAYENFIKGNVKSGNTFELLRRGRELNWQLIGAQDLLLAIRQSLTGADQSLTEAESLELFLHPDVELAVIVIKLKSLDVIYSELCRLLNVSRAEHPLRVLHLEVGSLWVRLFGESRVITLMTDLIRSGVGFIYRNFTREGKLSSIPMTVEKLESILNIEQRLRGAGLDTTEMQENIRLSGAMIAKHLNNLMTGEGVVTINNERLSVGSEVEKLFIEKSKALLLEDGGRDSTDVGAV